MASLIHRNFTIQSICTAYDYSWDEYFTFSGESHTPWEVVYVMTGIVEATEDARIYRLAKGDILFHAPMEFHKIKSADGTPHVLIFSFESQGKLPSLLSEGVFRLSPKEEEEYQALFGRIYAFFHNQTEGKYNGQECADCLASFLIRLSESHSPKEQLSITRDAALYHKLVTVMTENLYNNLSLEEIAEKLPISISYMKVLFRRYAGIGPKTYYSQLRCTEAIRLLQSGCSASETADLMNFSSPNYFSVFFKKITGMPPAMYARREGRSKLEKHEEALAIAGISENDAAQAISLRQKGVL